MPRSRQDLHSDLDLIEKAEGLLWKIKTCEPALDPNYDSPNEVPHPGPSATREQVAEWHHLLEERRRQRMEPRASAVAPLLEQLGSFRLQLEQIASRYLAPPRRMQRYCRVRSGGAVIPDRPVGVCRWGCNAGNLDAIEGIPVGCCEAALEELRRMREGIQAELATAADLVKGEPLTAEEEALIFTAHGHLQKNAARIIEALPAKTLHQLAKRAGLGLSVVKKNSVPLQKAGLMRKDPKDGYIRVQQ